MDIIKIKNVTVKYDDTQVFSDFSCTFKEGLFYTLLGPSGCGKTTLLRLIAGFAKPDKGIIYIDNEDVSNVPANLRGVNTVFQDYALFEHLDVFENIAFGLRLKNTKSSEINELVKYYLDMVNLQGYEKRKISELSGGQKQRVAIARAIINKPKVLLLDEPLSALDLKLRTEMQYVLKELQQKLKITFIFVTHDQEEALAMSDYIFVLNNGVIEHQGDPTDIYDEPNNRFVASFIGESNILKGEYISEYVVKFAHQEFECVDIGFEKGEAVDVVIRPEDLLIVDENSGLFNVKIEAVLFRGMHYEVTARDEYDNLWLIHTTKKFDINTDVALSFEPKDIHVMKVYDDK